MSNPKTLNTSSRSNDYDREMTKFIGEKYQKYYKENFEKITLKKPIGGFNWSAFFLTFAWLFYRKMYLIGLSFLALIILIGLISEYWGFQTTSTGLIISVILGMYGNGMYKQFSEKKIADIKKVNPTGSNVLRELQKEGGTNIWAGTITLLIIVSLTAYAFMGN